MSIAPKAAAGSELGGGFSLGAEQRRKSGDLAGLAQHLVHLGRVQLLGLEHFASELLQRYSRPSTCRSSSR